MCRVWCACAVLVQRLPQEARRQQEGCGGVRREMASARFLGDVRMLLRYDRSVTSDRREDVYDKRRRTQHDVAVAGGRHLRSSLPSSQNLY